MCLRDTGEHNLYCWMAENILRYEKPQDKFEERETTILSWKVLASKNSSSLQIFLTPRSLYLPLTFHLSTIFAPLSPSLFSSPFDTTWILIPAPSECHIKWKKCAWEREKRWGGGKGYGEKGYNCYERGERWMQTKERDGGRQCTVLPDLRLGIQRGQGALVIIFAVFPCDFQFSSDWL